MCASALAWPAQKGNYPGLPLDTGKQIYRAACVACHGPDGKGMPESTVGFKKPDSFPDFTRCDQTTAELDVAYKGVVVHGGPFRGFSQIMPSFGEALTNDQIDKVVKYLRGFCENPHWPRAELNLPRALVTEKAYPEDEVVTTAALNAQGAPGVRNDAVYEQRFGMKNEIEVDVPFTFRDQNHTWYGGAGDSSIGWKREIFSSLNTGSIFSLQGEAIFPLGNKSRGLGSGVTTFETFAAYGQLLPENFFFQFQGGADLPTRTDIAPQSVFWNTVVGQSYAQNRGLGRLWSPMVEFLATRNLQTGAQTSLGHSAAISGHDQQTATHYGRCGCTRSSDQHRGTPDAGVVLCLMGLARRQANGGLVMRGTASLAMAMLVFFPKLGQSAEHQKRSEPAFRTSDRCIACHNGLTTPSGRDVSIGFAWRASIMANSSRDPYWQASARRETMDHPEAKAHIEDECSVCHMPITRYEAKLNGQLGEIFSHLPFDADKKEGQQAEDGVDCSVCHQIGKEKLGTRESFNGGFVIDAPEVKNQRPEYGPFDIVNGNQRIMRTSTGGFLPDDESHIRDAKLCATCHTLYTEARGQGGKVIGELPEQMPYLEWLHSDYRYKQTCQDCHMPEVDEKTPIAKVLGVPRQGWRQHVFVGGDFLMENMLNRYRDDLSVGALPQELTAASARTITFLQAKAARISIDRIEVDSGRLQADVFVQNLGGHKLPTAFPSRRAWLHVVVRDRDHRTVFESGALNPNGSIQGNDNDADPTRFEPHYREIDSRDQVQIYEPILGDEHGHVTTGLLAAVGYLKDNRLLPYGFDKQTAGKDFAVYGRAADDPNFTGTGDRVLYSVGLGNAQGPFQVEAELWYQPIGYRWANNLKPYDAAPEPHRFNAYFDSMDSSSAVLLVRAEATK